MILDALQPFAEALQAHGARVVTPTRLTTAELRLLDAQIRRTSFYSAQTMFENILDRYKADVESIINPKQVLREGQTQTVTEGLNPAIARADIRKLFRSMDYHPEPGDEGTILDLSSDARINLVLKTNVETAQGAGHFIQQNDPNVIDDYPALELVRFEERQQPRDWETRCRLCAQVVGDVDAARVLEETGRMVALKSSPIWQALGDGADGSDDTLGNPYPPFAFGSGMWTQDVARDEAEQLGLIAPGETVEPNPLDITKLFSFSEEAA